MKYTRRIGYQYVAATPREEAESGLLFTITTTLRGTTWRASVYRDGRHRYYRNGEPALLAGYAMGLCDAATRLFGNRKPKTGEAISGM